MTGKDRLITIHAKMADVTEAEVDEVLNLTADMRDAELVRLRAESGRLREALRRYQWVGRLGHPRLWCPSCRNWKSQGHTTDCQLAAALKAEP